jgi:hypothetical protein
MQNAFEEVDSSSSDFGAQGSSVHTAPATFEIEETPLPEEAKYPTYPAPTDPRLDRQAERKRELAGYNNAAARLVKPFLEGLSKEMGSNRKTVELFKGLHVRKHPPEMVIKCLQQMEQDKKEPKPKPKASARNKSKRQSTAAAAKAKDSTPEVPPTTLNLAVVRAVIDDSPLPAPAVPSTNFIDFTVAPVVSSLASNSNFTVAPIVTSLTASDAL